MIPGAGQRDFLLLSLENFYIKNQDAGRHCFEVFDLDLAGENSF